VQDDVHTDTRSRTNTVENLGQNPSHDIGIVGK